MNLIPGLDKSPCSPGRARTKRFRARRRTGVFVRTREVLLAMDGDMPTDAGGAWSVFRI